MNKILTLLFIFFITILACAKIKHPEGGVKDEIAPTLILSNPTQGQVSFKGQEIILTFDKEVEIRGANKIKIFPSPQTETSKGFSCKARENIVKLKFDEKLKPNTTYTINFNNSIVSLSEEIPIENLVLSFSTGTEIDSMKVSGTVKDLLTNLPVPNADVLLYEHSDEAQAQFDLNKNLQNSTYLTKSDKDGNFLITNIKKGKYRIYATLNSSKASKFSPSMNKYGALLNPISLEEENISDLSIRITSADISELKILKISQKGPHAEILLSKPIEDYNFDKEEIISTLSYDKKSIYIYSINDIPSDLIEKKLTLNLYAKDNTHNLINEQIEISINNETSITNSKTIQSGFLITPKNESAIAEYGKLTISSLKPMINFDASRLDGIVLYLDETPIFLSTKDIEFNNSKDQLYINYDVSHLINFEKNPDYLLTLRISEGTLLDIDTNTNKEITNIYKIKNPKKHGSITGNIYTSNTDTYTIQLVTMDAEIVDEIESTSIQNNTYKFHLIKPGRYFVRILCYKNHNAFWSPGNYLKKILPDPVFIYPTPIEVLENWDIKDINFNID